LWQEMGRALLYVQHFEQALVTWLVLVFDVAPVTARADVEKAFEAARGRTLGALLKRLREKVKPTPNVDKLLAEMLDERNWMVHRLIYESADTLDGPDKAFGELVSRVRNVGERAAHLQQEFGTLLFDVVQAKYGIDIERLDAEAVQILSGRRQGTIHGRRLKRRRTSRD